MHMVHRVVPLIPNTSSFPTVPDASPQMSADGSLWTVRLEDKALWLWFFDRRRAQDRADGFVEHGLEAALS